MKLNKYDSSINAKSNNFKNSFIEIAFVDFSVNSINQICKLKRTIFINSLSYLFRIQLGINKELLSD